THTLSKGTSGEASTLLFKSSDPPKSRPWPDHFHEPSIMYDGRVRMRMRHNGRDAGELTYHPGGQMSFEPGDGKVFRGRIESRMSDEKQVLKTVPPGSLAATKFEYGAKGEMLRATLENNQVIYDGKKQHHGTVDPLTGEFTYLTSEGGREIK